MSSILWPQVSAGDLHAFDSLNLSPLAKVFTLKSFESTESLQKLLLTQSFLEILF